MEIAAIIVMGAIWMYREWMHLKQMEQNHNVIDKLTDKLMARNFEEYKELTTAPRSYDPVSRSEEDEWVMEQKEIAQ